MDVMQDREVTDEPSYAENVEDCGIICSISSSIQARCPEKRYQRIYKLIMGILFGKRKS